MKILKERKGFTLAEMLIVMAVVVVLAAAAVPAVSNTTESARESNDMMALAALYTDAYTQAAVQSVSGTAKSGDQTLDITETVTEGFFTQTTKGWGTGSTASTTALGGKIGGSTVQAPASIDSTTTSVVFKFNTDGTGGATLKEISAS